MQLEVVLDARGAELLRLTTDERSFSPVWSPIGDAIAYLEIDSGVTDLWLAPIDLGGTPTAGGGRLQLTVAAGLDPGSRPGWWVPAELIPTPVPTIPPSAPPSTGPEPSGSAAPATSTP